jgi:hypothetical protein
VRAGARRLGEQLASQAYAKDRRAALQRVADQLLLRIHPPVLVVLVDVHRASEDHHGVHVADVGRRLRARDPGRVCAEDARPRVQLVDYRENPHSGVT